MREHFTPEEELVAKRASWVLSCGARYWGDRPEVIAALEWPRVTWSAQRRCVPLMLPDWVSDVGVGETPFLLVDAASIAPGDGDAFERCNWLCAAYLFLSGAQEDPDSSTSYATLLRRVDPRIFDRAWVNRIFLLLRRTAARKAGVSELDLFGRCPKAEIRLTHDVDAVRKTAEIRFKQSAFHLFNAARDLSAAQWRRAGERLARAIRFVATTPNYWNFARLREMETMHGVRSTFHFYGGQRTSLRQKFFDPAYDVGAPALRQELAKLIDGGWAVGVHPSFESWNDPKLLRKERETVETACGRSVSECRQHWLRFSWNKTWQAQQEAGLLLDTTLGFNDRPGFRNGAALVFRPWDEANGRPLQIEAMPMVLMDSHFYDYAAMADDERRAAIAAWIGEIKAVGGQASVNWHVHTMATDYGWGSGYVDLLNAVT